jgi:hypothetical protein
VNVKRGGKPKKMRQKLTKKVNKGALYRERENGYDRAGHGK